MILESWEVRWFGKGAVPVILQQWSEENNLTTHPVRTDHYLMHSGGKALGIKWREGSLQIKELAGKVTLSSEVEFYKKWSFPLKEDDLLQKIETRGEWVGVTKKREMAKWTIEKGLLKRVEPGNEIIGVELEISAVMCKEKLWWTIALEATDSAENLEKVLHEIKLPEIEGAKRMGYAEWLEEVINGNS